MKNQFAKLFAFPNDENQLLCLKEYNEEDDSFNIVFRIGHPYITAQITAGYDEEEKRDLEFDAIDEEKAAGTYNSLKETVKSLETDN